MDFEESERVAWTAVEDHIRRWLPAMNLDVLETVAADLRPGSGGPWEGMAEDLDARRQLLLDEIARFAAERYGPWPIAGDLLPEAPNDATGLFDYKHER